METKKEIEKSLGVKLLALYERAPFGTASKKEVDFLVFDALVANILGRQSVVWWELGPEDVRQISLKLKVSESRVEALIEQVALQQSAASIQSDQLLDKIKKLALETRQDPKDISSGKFRLYVSNRVLRSAIESLLLDGGGLPETSFNRGQLVIRLGDLLVVYANQGGSDFLVKIAAKANDDAKGQAKKDIEVALNKKTLREKAAELGVILLNRVAGKGADEALEGVFKLITQEIKMLGKK